MCVLKPDLPSQAWRAALQKAAPCSNQGASLTVQVLGERSIMVNADRTFLRQAIVDLLHNAVKYSPEHSTVRVRVRETEKDAILEVQDRGPGIAQEHRERIFERFYRVDKSRTRGGGGAGLGLSIAKWAVSMHAGAIELQSEPDHGSTFRICIPKGGITAAVR